MIYVFSLIITLSILDIIYSGLTLNKNHALINFFSIIFAYPAGLIVLQSYSLSKLFEKNILMLSSFWNFRISLMDINLMIFIFGWLICAGVIGFLTFLNYINKNQYRFI